ncbi:MAG: metallophosphoesterase [Fibrobacter sp.]|nr:metallophosphoesterase [Fibrobacter sp.]
MFKHQVHLGQISDLHIGGAGELVEGIDTRAQFLRVLAHVQTLNLDLLVLSGDLANNEESEAYEFIARAMAGYPKDWCVMAGNHDRVETMSRFFEMKKYGDAYFYRRLVKGKPVLFLDSSSYTIPGNQLDWVREQAAELREEFLLFVHHPVCLCGHAFMDARYPLKNRDEVQAAFQGIKNLRFIFTGHYHTEMEVDWLDKKVYAAPAAFMQLDPFTPGFRVADTRPAWRNILWGDRSLQTSVHFPGCV